VTAGVPQAEQVARYEELSLNAWPARTLVFYDGWIVGLSEGYTRRANCVLPLRIGRLPAAAKISRCEELFRSAGLRACFKLTEFSQPGLDAALAGLGYGREAETLVDVVSLAGEPTRTPDGITITERVTPRWVDAHSRLHLLTECDRAALSAILARLRLPVACALATDSDGGGDAVACGLGTVDADTAGLFGIAVAETRRRQGLGRRITAALLAWAGRQGAERAFLQVTLANEGARALYEGMGFAEVYRYWYRSKGQRAAPVQGGDGPAARG
jgi:GNAT superfamily N-acetyltransferase